MAVELNNINSSDRLKQYGEYYTPSTIVEKMLSLVDNQLHRIDSRFLEPACGIGNFLEPILLQKLDLLNIYKRNLFEFEQYSLLALGSIYGIDILPDNIQKCRIRLLSTWENNYYRTIKDNPSEDVRKSAEFIVESNIVCGDALTMLNNQNEPLLLSEWSIIRSGKMQKKEFVFSSLLNDFDSFSPYGEFTKEIICDYWRIWDHVN